MRTLVIRKKPKTTAEKIMLLFGFQVKNFHARHASQEEKKKKSLLPYYLCFCSSLLLRTLKILKLVPQLTTKLKAWPTW